MTTITWTILKVITETGDVIVRFTDHKNFSRTDIYNWENNVDELIKKINNTAYSHHKTISAAELNVIENVIENAINDAIKIELLAASGNSEIIPSPDYIECSSGYSIFNHFRKFL